MISMEKLWDLFPRIKEYQKDGLNEWERKEISMIKKLMQLVEEIKLWIKDNDLQKDFEKIVEKRINSKLKSDWISPTEFYEIKTYLLRLKKSFDFINEYSIDCNLSDEDNNIFISNLKNKLNDLKKDIIYENLNDRLTLTTFVKYCISSLQNVQLNEIIFDIDIDKEFSFDDINIEVINLKKLWYDWMLVIADLQWKKTIFKVGKKIEVAYDNVIDYDYKYDEERKQLRLKLDYWDKLQIVYYDNGYIKFNTWLIKKREYDSLYDVVNISWKPDYDLFLTIDELYKKDTYIYNMLYKDQCKDKNKKQLQQWQNTYKETIKKEKNNDFKNEEIEVIHHKHIKEQMYNLFSKYFKIWEKIPLYELSTIWDLHFKLFLFETFKTQSIRSKGVLRGAINHYYKFKDIYEKIFIDNLSNLVWIDWAKKLVFIWFVETYFWAYKRKNSIASWIFQFTKVTAKKYWLFINWFDYRDDPVLSAQATAKYMSYVIRKRKKKLWKDGNIEDIIFLSLEEYNWWLITKLKKNVKTIQEYDSLLKDMYLEYVYVIKKSKNIEELRKKLIKLWKKYFKKKPFFIKKVKGKNWKITWDLYSHTFSKKRKKKMIKNLENIIMIQQFKYPWKLYGASKFFSYINKLPDEIKKEKNILINYKLWDYVEITDIIKFVEKYFVWKCIDLSIWTKNIKYKVKSTDNFETVVNNIYEKIPTKKQKIMIVDKIYVVRKNDTLQKICIKHNLKNLWITISMFKRFNKLRGDKIMVGQKLKIPNYVMKDIKIISKTELSNIVRDKLAKLISDKYELYTFFVKKSKKMYPKVYAFKKKYINR